jgi:hypothetical protein
MVKVVPRPIVFEAVLAGDVMRRPTDEWSGMPNAIHLAYKRGRLRLRPGVIEIETMAGRRLDAEAADWLLCADNGDVAAVSPEVFAERYQALGEATPECGGAG